MITGAPVIQNAKLFIESVQYPLLAVFPSAVKCVKKSEKQKQQ